MKATAAHPGYAATNLQSHSGSRLMAFAMEQVGNRLIAQDAAGGALPTLYAAVADIPGDSFAGPSGPFGLGLRGAPTLVARSAAASDEQAARRLWTGLGGPDRRQLPGKSNSTPTNGQVRVRARKREPCVLGTPARPGVPRRPGPGCHGPEPEAMAAAASRAA